MGSKQVARPSDLELQVLSVLWRSGPATARQVGAAMPDGKKRAYTTVLSVMQVMEKKGLLARSTEAQAHQWRPAVTRRQVLGPLMSQLVRNVFGGSRAAVIQQLLGDADLDQSEIDAIKHALADRRRTP